MSSSRSHHVLYGLSAKVPRLVESFPLFKKKVFPFPFDKAVANSVLDFIKVTYKVILA